MLFRSSPLSALDFTFAFCSGIVLSQTVGSFLALPKLFARSVGGYWSTMTSTNWTASVTRWVTSRAVGAPTDAVHSRRWYALLCRHEWLLALGSCVAMLWYFSFPILAQLVLLGLSFALIQHLNAFACRTGLGTYGRYMTFTMVPVMLVSAQP